MNKALRLISLIISVALVLTVVAGCGQKPAEEENSTTASTTEASVKPTEAPKQPVTVTMYVNSKVGSSDYIKAINEEYEKKTGNKVELNILPGEGGDFTKKMQISLLSGEQIDVVPAYDALDSYKYVTSELILPIDGIAQKAGYDMDKVFGKYLSKYDGKTYYIPNEMSTWLVFYNKTLFDKYNVPYPSGKDWTWEEYVETAKKLTDAKNGIYGSYALDYVIYSYFTARQQGVDGYKADGTSNFDAPEFKQALQFFKDLGNTHKVQPSWLEMKTKKLTMLEFNSGKYAMYIVPWWYNAALSNKEKYPYEFNWGVAPIPTLKDSTVKNNFGNVTNFGINKNAKNPDAAFSYICFWGENAYKYNNKLPAKVDITKDEINSIFAKIATPGNATVEDINGALFDNGLGFIQEQILGSIATEYNNIILQEAELYYVGQKSVDDAVKAIKQRADEAIVKAKSESENK